jgi:hypothetical protein
MRTFSPFLRASTASLSVGSSFFGRLSGSKGASAALSYRPSCLLCGALAHQKKACSSHRAILQ